MKCPSCGREYPESISKCPCGHDFASTTIEGIAASNEPKECGPTSGRDTEAAKGDGDLKPGRVEKKCRVCGKKFAQEVGRKGGGSGKVCPQCRAEDQEFIDALHSATPRVYICPAIIAINLLVFIAMVFKGVSWVSPTPSDMMLWGANFGSLSMGSEPWRLLTSAFLHIGILHLALNIWALWSFGPLVERLYGNWTFLVVYLLCAIGGSIASIAWNSEVLSAGASGAIFGITGSAITLLYGDLKRSRKAALNRRLVSLVFFVTYSILRGLEHGGIDNAAHLGGFALGLLAGWILRRPIWQPMPRARFRYGSFLAAVAALLFAGAWIAHQRIDFDKGKVTAWLLSDPSSIHITNALAKMKANRYEEAQAEAEEAVRKSPGSHSTHFLLGSILLHRNRVDQAAAEFRRSIEIDPNFHGAYQLLGEAYKIQKRYQEALPLLEKAVELKPDNAKDRVNLGRIQGFLGHYSASVKSLEKAIEIEPNNALAHAFLGVSYSRAGECGMAIDQFKKALSLNSRLEGVHLDLGFAHLLEGNFQEAAKALDVEIKGKNPKLYPVLWKHLALKANGQQQETLEFLTSRRDLFAENDWSTMLYRFHCGEAKEEELIDKATNPGERCEANFYAGYQSLLRGDRRKAEMYFRKSLETNHFSFYEYAGAGALLRKLDSKH